MGMKTPHPAAEVVASSMLAQPPEQRADYLRNLIYFAAGGLVALLGEREAVCEVYRTADSMFGSAE